MATTPGLLGGGFQPMLVGREQVAGVVLVAEVVDRLRNGIAQVPIDVDGLLGLLGEVDDPQDMRRDQIDDGGFHLRDPTCTGSER